MSVIGRKETTNGVAVDYEVFSSMAELVETCKTRPIKDNDFQDMAKKSYGSFEGVGSYAEALDLLRNGWDKYLQATKRAINDVGKCLYEKRLSFTQGVEGFMPIVPLALNRVPNAMVTAYYKPMKTRVVRLYFDCGLSAGYDEEEFVRNGQNLLKVVTKLEQQGYRVELNVCNCYAGSNDKVKMVVQNVKPASQLLDLKRVSFPLMHPAMLRVFGFDWYSKFPNTEYFGGYGKPLYNKYGESTGKIYKELFGDSSVCLAGAEIVEMDEKEIEDLIFKRLEVK